MINMEITGLASKSAIYCLASLFDYVKALSHDAIFHATCKAILHLRDVN